MFFTFVHICHLYCTLSRGLVFPNTAYKRCASNEPNSNNTCRLVGLVVSCWHQLKTANSSEVMSKIRPTSRGSVFKAGQYNYSNCLLLRMKRCVQWRTVVRHWRLWRRWTQRQRSATVSCRGSAGRDVWSLPYSATWRPTGACAMWAPALLCVVRHADRAARQMPFVPQQHQSGFASLLVTRWTSCLDSTLTSFCLPWHCIQTF